MKTLYTGIIVPPGEVES